MKIAMVCTEKLPVPPIRGGAIQQYISGLLPYLAKEHDITVFGRDDGELQAREEKKGVTYVRVPAPSADAYIHGVIEQMDVDYDLIHVFNRPLWVGKIAQKMVNSQISLSVHNEMLLPSKLPYEEGIECINRVKFISTVSDFIAREIEKIHPQAKDKLHTVYSGVDLDQYLPIWSKRARHIRVKLQKELGLTGKQIVLCVSRLSPKKGIHILIKAMEQVYSHNPETALVIVGSKWYGDNREDSYVQYIKKMAQDSPLKVVFTGFVPPAAITPYYYLGNIFVCASQWREPLARVHYEAMAAGLPIITTDRGGNSEVIKGEGNGFVIRDYAEPLAFANSIERLLQQPNLAEKMGRQGRKRAKEKYSWQRVAEQLNQLFKTGIQ